MVRVALAGGERAEGYRVEMHGRLFNQAELTRELQTGEGLSDTEIVARAFERWGTDAIPRLKGMYCLVVTNQAEGLAALVRDRIGLCPVFWIRRGADLYVAAAPAPLRQVPGVRIDVSPPVLAAHLSNLFCGPEDSFFNGVRRLPAGHALVFRDGSQKLIRYWTPNDQVKALGWVREDELHTFDDLLTQAIIRCTPRARSAVTLSGGLDSASIAAFGSDAARTRGAPAPLALSLIFPHPECNEELVQRGVARRLGLEQRLYRFDEAVGPGGLLRSALEVTQSWPAPLDNLWYPAYRCLYEHAAAHGIRDVLTGSGGDEWLNVTPAYAADLISRGDLPGLLRLIRHYRQSFSLPLSAMLRNLLWTSGLRPVLVDHVRSVLRTTIPSALSSRRRRHLESMVPAWIKKGGKLVAGIVERQPEGLVDDSDERYKHYFRGGDRIFVHPLISMEMEDHFEAGRRAGVAIMHPYWDADLIDFLYRVPPELLYRDGCTKSLVRGRMALRFPGLGFERQRKISALNFVTITLLEEAPTIWRELGGLTALADLGIVEPGLAADEVTKSLNSTDTRKVFMVWRLMNFETWLRANG